MVTKVEFLSDGYLEALRQAYEARSESVHAEFGDRRFITCEVYTGVPAHLASSGQIAFPATFQDRAFEFAQRVAEDADILLRGDYAALHPIARFVTNGDPDRQAEFMRMIEEAVSAKKLEVRGDFAAAPSALADVHDEVARVTA